MTIVPLVVHMSLNQYLSKELNKTIVLWCEWACQRTCRCLVDAMSGFGVKSPLRRFIITDDFMFNNAAELTICF